MTAEPFGRESELALLEAFLAPPSEPPDGRLRVALIVGEPGIGKSLLWQRTIDAATERAFTVLSSRPAENERALPNVVLGDLFRDLAPSHIAPLSRPRRRALEAALLISGSSDTPPDATVDGRALGAAVSSVLRSTAEQHPLLIAIDDDQWMDASSAASLAFALRRSADLPIRLLLARRSRTRPPIALERIDGDAIIERLEVGPMSLGATHMLLRDQLDITLSRPVLREVYGVSAGNPFHALELARAKTRDPSRDLALPVSDVSIDHLLRARMRDLDGATRQALLFVAANGRTPVELLDALGISPETLERAAEAGFLVPAGNSMVFTHPLLAAAAYDVGLANRRAAHRRLGRVIEDEVLRARHVALGAAGPSRSISAMLEAAARLAGERLQSVAAADIAEQAARLTPANDLSDRHRRTLAAARARLATGDGNRARELLASLLAADTMAARRAETLLLAADLEAPAKAVDLLVEALQCARAEPRLRAVIHARLGDLGRLTRGRTWAERHAQAALRSAQVLGDRALRARALSTIARLRFEGAELGALHLAHEAYQLASAARDDELLRETAMTVGHLLTWSGDTSGARRWFEDQVEAWRDRDEIMHSECLWYLAIVELWAGRWTIATTHADEAMEMRTQYGIEFPPDHLPAAMIALHRGDFALARQRSERALELADGMLIPGHLGVLATVDLWAGDPAGAIEAFTRAEAAVVARGIDDPSGRWWRAEYAEALIRTGRIADTRRLLEDWSTVALRLDRLRDLAAVARVRGLIASAEGDLVAASRLLDDAAAGHDAAADRFGWARARLAAGIVHLRLRRKRLARIALESAATVFADLGASSWATEARAELARIGGRERIEGMSPSERRVVELVVEGRTNRDIAAALFVTERTVASHLTHVYAKLGVRSRTELAHRLAQDEGKVPTS